MKKTVFILLTLIFIFSLATGVLAAPGNEWDAQVVKSGFVSPSAGYMMNWERFFHSVENPNLNQMYKSLHDLLVAETALTVANLAGLSEAEIRDVAHAMGFIYYITEIEDLSNQTWAVAVEAKPGHYGILKQKFEAAYGPYDRDFSEGLTDEVRKDSFGFSVDDSGLLSVVKGEDYVGNYFNIDQHVATSDGVAKRYINISSPWSGAYSYEDMEITGWSEIIDDFIMHNLAPGKEERLHWWHLF